MTTLLSLNVDSQESILLALLSLRDVFAVGSVCRHLRHIVVNGAIALRWLVLHRLEKPNFFLPSSSEEDTLDALFVPHRLHKLILPWTPQYASLARFLLLACRLHNVHTCSGCHQITPEEKEEKESVACSSNDGEISSIDKIRKDELLHPLVRLGSEHLRNHCRILSLSAVQKYLNLRRPSVYHIALPIFAGTGHASATQHILWLLDDCKDVDDSNPFADAKINCADTMIAAVLNTNLGSPLSRSQIIDSLWSQYCTQEVEAPFLLLNDRILSAIFDADNVDAFAQFMDLISLRKVHEQSGFDRRNNGNGISIVAEKMYSKMAADCMQLWCSKLAECDIFSSASSTLSSSSSSSSPSPSPLSSPSPSPSSSFVESMVADLQNERYITLWMLVAIAARKGRLNLIEYAAFELKRDEINSEEMEIAGLIFRAFERGNTSVMREALSFLTTTQPRLSPDNGISMPTNASVEHCYVGCHMLQYLDNPSWNVFERFCGRGMESLDQLWFFIFAACHFGRSSILPHLLNKLSLLAADLKFSSPMDTMPKTILKEWRLVEHARAPTDDDQSTFDSKASQKKTVLPCQLLKILWSNRTYDDSWRFNPLLTAALSGSFECVRTLVEFLKRPNDHSESGLRVLKQAWRGNVRVILDSIYDANVQDSMLCYMIDAGAEFESFEVRDMCIDCGLSVMQSLMRRQLFSENQLEAWMRIPINSIANAAAGNFASAALDHALFTGKLDKVRYLVQTAGSSTKIKKISDTNKDEKCIFDGDKSSSSSKEQLVIPASDYSNSGTNHDNYVNHHRLDYTQQIQEQRRQQQQAVSSLILSAAQSGSIECLQYAWECYEQSKFSFLFAPDLDSTKITTNSSASSLGIPKLKSEWIVLKYIEGSCCRLNILDFLLQHMCPLDKIGMEGISVSLQRLLMMSTKHPTDFMFAVFDRLLDATNDPNGLCRILAFELADASIPWTQRDDVEKLFRRKSLMKSLSLILRYLCAFGNPDYYNSLLSAHRARHSAVTLIHRVVQSIYRVFSSSDSSSDASFAAVRESDHDTKFADGFDAIFNEDMPLASKQMIHAILNDLFELASQ